MTMPSVPKILATAFATTLLVAVPSALHAQTVPVVPLAPADDITENEAAGITVIAQQGYRLTAAERSVPPQLTPHQRLQYRRAFLALRAGRESAARQILASMRRGVLHSVIEGEILLKEGNRASKDRLAGWLRQNPRSPQAPAIAAIADRLGMTDRPPLVQPRQLKFVRLTPAAVLPKVTPGTAFEREFVQRADALLKAEKPLEIEDMLRRDGRELGTGLRTEWMERAAWMAYIGLDDRNALRLAAEAAKGSGAWAALGDWVAGLSAFRMQDLRTAARHFDAIAEQRVAPDELRSAGAYWAARTHIRLGAPHLAPERLKLAVARDHTGFYGLLAARVLGVAPNFDWREPDFMQADWTTLKQEPGAQRAAALVEVGELDLADRELRHLAATATATLYEPALRLAARLNLPATQYWLASNPPLGQMPPMSARLPTPDWKPLDGWRVDPDLVFAHALQESRFITTARSGPGAKGAMQLMPGTARDIARAKNIEHRDDLLNDPSFNIEYGQSYLEQLRDSTITGGRLPLVIASYNAGLAPIKRWNEGGVRYHGDPLLYMESIPYWETRHYVRIVLRNYWLYQLKGEADSTPPLGQSIRELAENRWPRFPERPPASRTRH